MTALDYALIVPLHSGFLKHTLLFLLSTVFAVIGALALLIGATIWTVIIKKAESINNFVVGSASQPVPLGITVSTGDALFLVWASWACLLVSIMPYMIRYGNFCAKSEAPSSHAHPCCTVAARTEVEVSTDAGHPRLFLFAPWHGTHACYEDVTIRSVLDACIIIQ